MEKILPNQGPDVQPAQNIAAQSHFLKYRAEVALTDIDPGNVVIIAKGLLAEICAHKVFRNLLPR